MSKNIVPAVLADLPIVELPEYAPYLVEGVLFLKDFEYGYDRLKDYKDEYAAGSGTPWQVQVTHFVVMTNAQYRQFCESLHCEFDWLEGRGSASYTGERSIKPEDYAVMTPDDQQSFINSNYRKCLLITNQLTLERLFVDPVRSKVPWFVGISS